jgi:hypothetical protein
MKYNVVYNSNQPRTLSNDISLQTVAGLIGVNDYIVSVPYVPQSAPAGNPDAAAVIKSNGENIANPIRKSNPFPPGLTS